MSKSTNRAVHKSAPKRIIKASKGGRTARAPEARITPQALVSLWYILKSSGMSYADWLTAHIEHDAAPDPAQKRGEA